MKQNKSLKLTATLLILLPLALIMFRISSNERSNELRPDHKFSVEYRFSFEAGAPFKITSFLPVTSHRQAISILNNNETIPGSIYLDGENKRIQWRGQSQRDSVISFLYDFRGKPVSYRIAPGLPYSPDYSDDALEYTQPTDFIQSTHPRIHDLANTLSEGKESLIEVLQSFYDFVYAIPSTKSSELTDALLALEQHEASCNGKSRLFVALCRSMHIPARVSGGLILEEVSKKTSHLWAEVLIEGQWVPFDALNGHFASLPAHYIELYKGDHFLITRNKSLPFDYIYHIKKTRTNDFPVFAALNIWQLIDEAGVPQDMFEMLLLLPFGAFLVAIAKNIIGLKTYGVFLPVLISLSLLETGWVPGLILFTTIIGIVAVVNFPLDKWGIQFNSKIASMLIAVVICALLAVKVLHITGWLSASAPLFFPIIILTIVSERVARKIEEEGVRSSIMLYGSTLLVTVLIYFILSSEFIRHFVLTFPEIIITVAGFNLLLGKWIGLRVMEYYRFHQLANQ